MTRKGWIVAPLSKVSKSTWKLAGGTGEPPTYAKIAEWAAQTYATWEEETERRLKALMHGLVTEESTIELDFAPTIERIPNGQPRHRWDIRVVGEVPLPQMDEDWDCTSNLAGMNERIGGLAWWRIDPDSHTLQFMLTLAWLMNRLKSQIDATEKSGGEPPNHPLGPLIRAFADDAIRPETRKDTAIVPKIKVVESPGRHRGRLVGGLVDDHPQLPTLFPEIEPTRYLVPLLEIADSAKDPIMTKGRGAPLAARMMVRLMVSVPLEDRHRNSFRMAISIRELANMAGYGENYKKNKHWPRILAVLYKLRDYSIPAEDSWWFPFALRRLPAKTSPDDIVVLDVAFPAAETAGPMVSMTHLDRLARESGPRWRSYIAAHTLTFKPGKNRVPVGNDHWAWRKKVGAYPVLDQDCRRRLAFGNNDKKHRSQAEQDAPWQNLPGLVLIDKNAIDAKTGVTGYRYVPTELAKRWEREKGEKNRRGQPGNLKGSTGEFEGVNRGI